MKITLSFAIATVCATVATMAPAEVIHATWGGAGAVTLNDYVMKPFSEKTGIETRVAEVPNTAGAVRSPTATQYNVVTTTYFEGVSLAQADLLEGFSDEELPNVADLPQNIVLRNAAGQIVGVPSYFTYYGITFNNEQASAEDFTSWNSLKDPKWKGKLAMTRPVYSSAYDLTIYAHANGGDAANVDAGKELLEGLIGNSLTTYTSLAHMNTLLGTGEVTAVPFYASRVWDLRRKGQTNIEMAIPKEGALLLAYTNVMPKGAADREETRQYLNFLASAESQVNISVQTGNIPTNKNAVLPQAYIDTIGMTQEELMSKMYTPDWNAVVENHEERLNMVEQMMSNAGN